MVDHATSMARKIWHHPENQGVRGRRLVSWMTWQVWERTVGGPRIVRLHDQVRLVCHPHDQVTSLALYFGLYDSQEMRFLLAWLRPGETFFDVGANVAPYSLLATLVDDVTAVAFEPESVARERASANIRLNNAERRVLLVPCAVSQADGSGHITTDRWAQNALVEKGYEGEVENVETICLDSFTDARGIERVSLIKIDVEGHEPDVLLGATALIAEHRPALIVECNDARALQRFARDHDYTPVTYSPRTGALDMVAWPTGPSSNVILVPDLQRARERVGTTVRSPSRVQG